jgi:hypothetical protein
MIDGSTLDGFRIEGLKIKATGAGGPGAITANGGIPQPKMH